MYIFQMIVPVNGRTDMGPDSQICVTGRHELTPTTPDSFIELSIDAGEPDRFLFASLTRDQTMQLRNHLTARLNDTV